MDEKKERKPILDPEKLFKALDWLYDKATTGISGQSGCWKLAEDYREKYHDPKLAAKKLARAQVAKCTISGTISSVGGIITLPIALPANITTVWFIELQMIAAIAVLGGYDPSHDEVRMLSYACLGGSGVMDAMRTAGVDFAVKGGKVLISKIPVETVKAINKKLGMRFITKWGETGIINLGKMVPVLGAGIGGGFDLVSSRIIANTAIKTFLVDKILEE